MGDWAVLRHDGLGGEGTLREDMKHHAHCHWKVDRKLGVFTASQAVGWLRQKGAQLADQAGSSSQVEACVTNSSFPSLSCHA